MMIQRGLGLIAALTAACSGSESGTASAIPFDSVVPGEAVGAVAVHVGGSAQRTDNIFVVTDWIPGAGEACPADRADCGKSGEASMSLPAKWRRALADGGFNMVSDTNRITAAGAWVFVDSARQAGPDTYSLHVVLATSMMGFRLTCSVYCGKACRVTRTRAHGSATYYFSGSMPTIREVRAKLMKYAR